MRKNLIRYLPEILKRNLDFRILMEVQETEVQNAWDASTAVFDNQFITTADEYGIARYEGILGLHPNKDDDLEDRRKAVLMAWFRRYAIGIPDLQEVADIWAPNMSELEYRYPLMLIVWMTENAPYGPVKNKSMWRELRELTPANVQFDFAWKFLRVKDMHRQMSVAELNNTPLSWFAGGTGMSDRSRGSGILSIGNCIIVQDWAKVTIRDDGHTLHISDSTDYRYEAPAYEQIGDGVWAIDGALTIAGDSQVTVRDDGETLHITSYEEE